MDKQYQEFQKNWAKVVAKCWSDEAFKKQLMQNPKEVLKEHGIKAPEGMNFEVEENTEKVIHLVLPQKPEGEISEDMMRNIAGGLSTSGKCATL